MKNIVIKRIFQVLFICMVISIFSSCALFKKKRKCNDCPTWSKIETMQNENKTSV